MSTKGVAALGIGLVLLLSGALNAKMPSSLRTGGTGGNGGTVRSLAAPQQAVTALEMLGLSLQGRDFVRAVAAQNRPLTELFLAAGMDLNQADGEGRTALFAAITSRQWELAQRLLDAGADSLPADHAGRTALMAAVLQRQPALIEALLASGADPAATDENGHSALHFAVILRDRELVARFSKLGTPLNGRCCDDHDLVGHALESREWTIIEPILTQTPPLPAWSSIARGILQTALQARDLPRIRLLLSKHLPAPTPDGRKEPLIAYALVSGQRDLLELLLEAGTDPNSLIATPVEKVFSAMVPSSIVRHYLEEEPGMNLLMLAAGLGRPNEVKLLLERGAKRGATTRSKYKLAALNFAAWAQCPESQQLLIGKCPTPEQLRIEISIGGQTASLYKNGVPIVTTHISTGRPGYSTPEGRYVITDKHSFHISTIYKVKMPFFMRLSCREFGMHEGYAENPFASHGCIRVPGAIARRLFREAPVGTLVTISR